MENRMYMTKELADMRERIVFGDSTGFNVENYLSGTREFSKMNVETAEKLIENGFLDPDEYQNESPTVEEMIAFAQQMKREHDLEITFHGYVVSPMRDDVRISFEGLECESDFTVESIIFWVEFNRYANELELGEHRCYSWWD